MEFENTPYLIKWISTVLIITLLSVLHVLLYKLVNQRVESLRDRYLWRQTVTYLVVSLGALVLIRIWFEWFQSFLTLLSLVMAALIVVSKELLLNVIANFSIVWRQLFTLGERIQIGTVKGDVVEMGPVYFTVAEVGEWVQGEETTGRMVKVPNYLVLTTPVINYARSFSLVWNEIVLDLPKGTAWQKARDIFQGILNRYSHNFSDEELKEIREGNKEIVFTQTEPKVYCRLVGDKIQLTGRYACLFYKRRHTEFAIWNDLLEKISADPDIDLGLKRN